MGGYKEQFLGATTEKEIKSALVEKAKYLKNSNNKSMQYVYHYTNATAAISIIKSKYFYIGSPEKMNDGLELGYLSDMNIKNMFFACFISEDEENIGMWSMYAQPWDDGVIIRIPVDKFKAWIEKPNIFAADPVTKKTISQIYDGKVSQYFVAYTNVDSKGKDEDDILSCGNIENRNIKLNKKTLEALVGYIKDRAWSYEKELRLSVTTSSTMYKAVSIEIPEEILDSFEIITGPRYEKNLLALMRKEVAKDFKASRIIPSTFTGRLNKVYCDSCKYKRCDN